MSQWKTGIFALLFTVVCVGCGESGPEIATVEGTVTIDGKPLPNASVVFMPENGRTSGAWTDENGYYELNFSGGRQGAIPGKNRVSISTFSDPMELEDGTMQPGRRESVPMRYNSQTELTYVVKDGEANVADFELTSEGEVRDTSHLEDPTYGVE